jgi:hypothetical protein
VGGEKGMHWVGWDTQWVGGWAAMVGDRMGMGWMPMVGWGGGQLT